MISCQIHNRYIEYSTSGHSPLSASDKHELEIFRAHCLALPAPRDIDDTGPSQIALSPGRPREVTPRAGTARAVAVARDKFFRPGNPPSRHLQPTAATNFGKQPRTMSVRGWQPASGATRRSAPPARGGASKRAQPKRGRGGAAGGVLHDARLVAGLVGEGERDAFLETHAAALAASTPAERASLLARADETGRAAATRALARLMSAPATPRRRSLGQPAVAKTPPARAMTSPVARLRPPASPLRSPGAHPEAGTTRIGTSPAAALRASCVIPFASPLAPRLPLPPPVALAPPLAPRMQLAPLAEPPALARTLFPPGGGGERGETDALLRELEGR